MRAVICWSMKSRMVARMAGIMAANGAQLGRPLPRAKDKRRQSNKNTRRRATTFVKWTFVYTVVY